MVWTGCRFFAAISRSESKIRGPEEVRGNPSSRVECWSNIQTDEIKQIQNPLKDTSWDDIIRSISFRLFILFQVNSNNIRNHIMCTPMVLDQAIEEWSYLVKRQEYIAYKVIPSSTSKYRQHHSSLSQAEEGGESVVEVVYSCPTIEWRERNCEWCFDLTDRLWVEWRRMSSLSLRADSFRDNSSVSSRADLLYCLASFYRVLKQYWSRCNRDCTILLWSLCFMPNIYRRDYTSAGNRCLVVPRVETS